MLLFKDIKMCKISIYFFINTRSLGKKFITYNCGVSIIIVLNNISTF